MCSGISDSPSSPASLGVSTAHRAPYLIFGEDERMAGGVGERVADTVARAATWRFGKGALPVPPEQRLPIILTLIGALCMPLGLVLVILGWWGAANTPYDFEQLPYLISGGLFGIALCLLGGFL